MQRSSSDTPRNVSAGPAPASVHEQQRADHCCLAYQVLLRGPTKVEYLFLEHSQYAMPPVNPSKETLFAINTHFWDWIWWLATKATVGRQDLVAEHVTQLYGHLLRPMGVETVPESIGAAIRAFLARRDELERHCGLSVPRALEDEVRRGIRRIGDTT
jgi:hypothetical protein